MPKQSGGAHADLLEAVNSHRKRATVRAMDLSLNELADMISAEELIITPDYQRMFRWGPVKQSQFVESILLEMPIPPIYMIERGEGRYELIDGLQRLSTYLHLIGEYENEELDYKRGVSLTLTGCSIVPELNGLTLDALGPTLKHRLKRATLRAEIVRDPTDTRFAYHMFTRLNTGGEPLSEQEVRHCAIRLLGTKFLDFIITLTNEADFRIVVEDVTAEFAKRKGLDELVLRFFAFKNNLGEYVHSIGEFLTDFLERVTDTQRADSLAFDYAIEKKLFKKSFDVLARAIGRDACRRWVESQKAYSGGFSISHYEAFCLGVARVVPDFPETLSGSLITKISSALRKAKEDPQLREVTVGGGKNFKRLYERKIGIVESCLREAL